MAVLCKISRADRCLFGLTPDWAQGPPLLHADEPVIHCLVSRQLYPSCGLRLQVEASVGRRPDRDWVRSSGRPCNRWIDQLRQDHQRPPADLWRPAIRRGHTGATL